MFELYQLTSFGFLILTIALSIIYWILPAKLRKFFILGLSVIFLVLYSYFHAIIVFVLLGISYFCAKKLKKNKLKRYVVLPIIVVLLNLIFFKYTLVPDIIIFLGISYFSFRIIHYVVEVYKNNIKDLNFLNFVNYVIFFPCFVAGPIHRYTNFNPQKPKFKLEDYSKGFARVIIGLFKKVVIVDTIAVFTAELGQGTLSTGMIWLAVYLLSIQIYLDFSAYSDIAIGISRMFGYKIMENFNWPYLKQNLSLFWKNWHISLTSWIKDYVFIPLGGSRVVLWRILLNIMIIMVLVGIWHGATFNFVVWGAIHGIGLIILRLYRMLIPLKQKELPVYRKAWGAFITFNFVTFTWLFFFFDIGTVMHILTSLFLA